MAVSSSSGGSAGGIRMGRAFVEVAGKDVGLTKMLDGLKKGFKRFGLAIAGMGAGSVGVGLGGLAAIGKFFDASIDRATEISRLATKLGVTTEELSSFAYAAKTTGMSLEDLTGQFENLAERVNQGAMGSGEAADTFKKLGIDAAQLKLQNPVQQMLTLAEAMQGVTNETERLGMLSSLGGDQFQWMNNIFKQGPAGIRALMKEAGDVGAVVNSDTAKQAVRASAASTRAWTAIKNAILAIGEALLPQVEHIEAFTNHIVMAAKAVRVFINENRGMVLGIVAGLSAAVVFGEVVIGLGAAFVAAGFAIGGIVSIYGALATLVSFAIPITVVTGLLVGLVAVVGAVAAELGLFEATLEGVQTLIGFFGKNVGAGMRGISAALAIGDFAAAFKIAALTVDVIWRGLVLRMTAAWAAFKDDFVDGWSEIKLSIKHALGDAFGFVFNLVYDVSKFIDKAFGALIGGIVRSIGELISTLTQQRLFRDALGITNNKAFGALGEKMKNSANPTFLAVGQAQIDQVNADYAEGKRQEIEQLKADIAQRRKNRMADVAAADAKLKAAEAELAAAEQAAQLKKAIAIGARLFLDVGAGLFGAGMAPGAMAAQLERGASRGGFNVDRAGEQFGSTITETIAKNTQNTAENTKEIIKRLEYLRGEWG